MANVGILTPHGDRVPPLYNRHITSMQLQFPQHMFIFVEVDCIIVGKARVMLVDTALAEHLNLDVFWFIDDDTLIPPHAGVIVDQALELGVVSGVYFSRRPPFIPQVYESAVEEQYVGMYWPKINIKDLEGLTQEDAVGAGCLAVRADIFQTLVDAWSPRVQTAFEVLKDLDPPIAKIVKQLNPWFEFLESKGEDIYFSERCKEAGIPIWVNWGIECIHLGQLGISREHFDYLIDNNLLIKGEELLQ